MRHNATHRKQRRSLVPLGWAPLIATLIFCCAPGLDAQSASASPASAAEDQAVLEMDWRKQDGIGTERVPVSYPAAVAQVFARGDALVKHLQVDGVSLGEQTRGWEKVRAEWQALVSAGTTNQAPWEDLWRRMHQLRREIVFASPLADTGPILFAKQVPGMFSHQLTQYYGSCAKPGGGIFVLDSPGRSLAARQLGRGALPLGSYQHPEVSREGQRVLFAYCHAESTPPNRESHLDRFYHLYEMKPDGTGLKQLTDGSYDDFSPRFLPNGDIVCVSTRRGGYHRCGRGPCPTYTLALLRAGQSVPEPISFHETHEWDPAVLWDGQIIYTRWDYVDRHAVYYQQLWTTRPDGTGAAAFYGNNTFNPVGVWEARPVPGMRAVMATAAAHHAMTAGSIILLDITAQRDGQGPITRLTPDAPFPESEIPIANLTNPNAWYGRVEGPAPPLPAEAKRWPGHCYRSAYPLSANFFLAAYSFHPLIGEPDANASNMFGIYLVDSFGNKELLHRDLEISSIWPVPLRGEGRHSLTLAASPASAAAPIVTSSLDSEKEKVGLCFVQNVHESWPVIPSGTVKQLRVVQVLPKSTWHANDPMVGLANASPGRQVLGTVPVERDGSAWFRAPARVPLAFQALDEHGEAVQMMRSIVYLQPGETLSCVGCHEQRHTAPPQRTPALALNRTPSSITPAPEGSLPLSYPRLVQPVLDRHCVRCHNATRPDGGVILTAEPEGRFTKSYNALVKHVPFSAWGSKPGDFRAVNSEPLTEPGFFGARGSALMKLLRKGHEDVKLPAEDKERLVTWMDANALFYGTFEPKDQARQLRGEQIAGAGLH
jgi:hypothetical protein